MVELLVERIDVFEDKICIKLKYSDTPPDGTNKQNDKELMRDFENEEIDAPKMAYFCMRLNIKFYCE